MDVSGCGLGVKPELGLVSGSSSSSSSGGSLNETSSSSSPSSSLEIKLKSSFVSVEQMNTSVNQSINFQVDQTANRLLFQILSKFPNHPICGVAQWSRPCKTLHADGRRSYPTPLTRTSVVVLFAFIKKPCVYLICYFHTRNLPHLFSFLTIIMKKQNRSFLDEREIYRRHQ